MTWLIICSVAGGFFMGFFLNHGVVQNLNQISTIALAALLLGIGIDLGGNKKLWQSLKDKGWRILLIPFATGVGTVAASTLIAPLLGLALKEGAAVGAGFGWYSLSGVLLAKMSGDALGALAFLTNVFRELLAVLLMPALAKHLGYLTPIAAGGATAMDTTLPLISSVTDQETTLYSFASGAILSSLVPILVPLFIQL